MKRDYQNSDLKKVNFFIGNEIENSLNKNKKTLFVVGGIDTDIILHNMTIYQCQHLFLGANHSLHEALLDIDFSNKCQILSEKYPVTIDCLIQEFYSLPKEILSNYNITKVIRMPIPEVDSCNNVYLKIDDTTFNYSNQGVWVSSLSDIMKPDNFTSWDEYKKDFVIE